MLAQEKLQVKEIQTESSVFSIWKECWSFRFGFMKMRRRKFWKDLYSPARNLLLGTERRLCEQFVMKNASRCKASGKIQVQGAKPQVLQVAHVTGSIRDRSGKGRGGRNPDRGSRTGIGIVYFIG